MLSILFFLTVKYYWIKHTGQLYQNEVHYKDYIWIGSTFIHYHCCPNNALWWSGLENYNTKPTLTETTGYFCEGFACSDNRTVYDNNPNYTYLTYFNPYYYYCKGVKAPLLKPSQTPKPTPKPTPTPSPTPSMCPVAKLIMLTPPRKRSLMSIINPYLYFIFE